MRHGDAAAGSSVNVPADCGDPARIGDIAHLAEAQRRDVSDPLAPFAQEFHVPRAVDGSAAIYLCGHSLGLQPKSAPDYVERELAEWRDRAVTAHFETDRPWVSYHEHALAGLRELTGAEPIEVVAMNSLTVNLHLMLTSFFRPSGDRNRILMEGDAFSSDRYAIVSHLRLHALSAAEHLIELRARPGERVLRTEDMITSIEQAGPRLSLVLLPGVQYLTGQAFELPPIIAAAHRSGAVVGLDLAHAIGNIPLRLHDWGADFAVWCSYKYLNAGPGAIGGCFVHARHACSFELPRLAGWWGHNKTTRFQMGSVFDPLPGAEGWQLSNPPILATAPLLASLEIFSRAGLPAVRAKSMALTQFLCDLIDANLRERVEIVTPKDPAQRGCQLSLRINSTVGAFKTKAPGNFAAHLGAVGVIGDWREPDILRLAPTPLYNSFVEVFEAVHALRRALTP